MSTETRTDTYREIGIGAEKLNLNLLEGLLRKTATPGLVKELPMLLDRVRDLLAARLAS